MMAFLGSYFLLALFPMVQGSGVRWSGLPVFRLYGHPKSGTTWLEVIIAYLEDATKWKVATHAPSGPNLKKFRARMRSEQGSFTKHQLPGALDRFAKVDSILSGYHDALVPCLEEMVFPWDSRCANISHLATDVVKRARYILILRDPRAVIVSWLRYSQAPIKTGSEKHFHAPCQNNRELKTVGPHSRKIASFRTSWNRSVLIEQTTKVAALISLRYHWHTDILGATTASFTLFYEDLVATPFAEYSRLANFLSLKVQPSLMEKVAAATTPKAMRQLERCRNLPGRNNAGGSGAKVRRAKSQGFRSELDSRTLCKITRNMRSVLHPVLNRKWLDNRVDVERGRC